MIDINQQEVLNASLSLPAHQRAELAEQLWESLDDGRQEEVNEAWAIELQRRWDDYKSGRATVVDGPITMSELKRNYGIEE